MPRNEINYALSALERRQVFEKIFMNERFSPEFMEKYFDFLADIRKEAARLAVELAAVVDPEQSEIEEDNSLQDDIEVLKYFDYVLRFENWDGTPDDDEDDDEDDYEDDEDPQA